MAKGRRKPVGIGFLTACVNRTIDQTGYTTARNEVVIRGTGDKTPSGTRASAQRVCGFVIASLLQLDDLLASEIKGGSSCAGPLDSQVIGRRRTLLH
jgi:hypothetical protein